MYQAELRGRRMSELRKLVREKQDEYQSLSDQYSHEAVQLKLEADFLQTHAHGDLEEGESWHTRLGIPAV